jgi:proteasome lid subunit RPN8/RPN11
MHSLIHKGWVSLGLARLLADVPEMMIVNPACMARNGASGRHFGAGNLTQCGVQSNTRRGIESCGVIGGELTGDSSAFTITKLILPQQKGEQNTVEVTDEGEVELFNYMQERSLIPLGWIHTHPTQTCFLSSIDVHTQSGYQVRLAPISLTRLLQISGEVMPQRFCWVACPMSPSGWFMNEQFSAQICWICKHGYV